VKLYEVLGLQSGAAPKEIKAAYRVRAQETHPDREGGSVEAFQEVSNAYEVLSDTVRRARYDETGTSAAMPDQESSAREQIVGRLNAALASEIDFARVDLLAHIRNEVVTAIDNHKRIQIPGLKRHEKRIMEVLKRLKKKGGGESFMNGVLELRLQQQRDQLVAMEQAQKVLERMLVILAEHEFQVDAQQFIAVSSVTSTFTISSTNSWSQP
jgi:curved DNA-binding protein CbpA